ncbi:MAG: tRNA (adenosine(37)-N6)-threonylcarbamoyltransferase complex transferase subunit TsaD [Candidatus Moranbacteria bacterium RIFCSPHIGHO2_01_FULL_55_24]|nr:MAG: tRNA (adenosine(37)-N6)-threonylcarbamoyltransferase complex transferase subunit TsaD [Candidatus Moranbacteria bacterium RIFCSPHIGHO2_01_FULL_55_24]
MTKILAIETSCDETAAAILEKTEGGISVLANTVQSQASLHAKWGGVVPTLASREHIKNIVPVLEECLERARVTPQDIDAIAVTQGPGLMPALIVGVNAAKTLSLLWQKPLLGIQHLEGHIYANLLQENTELRFPLLALVVSGGHTELVLMRDHFQYEILGETQDDAAGEAFDKVAKLLGLAYPGGPEVAARADAFREAHTEEELRPLAEKFPRPMLTADNYDFSFSGLKTAVLYSVQKESAERKADPDFVPGMCYAFQEAVVDVLVGKTERALREYSPQTFVIAGGVSANVHLRASLQTLLQTDFPETQFLTPPFAYSLDNAAMIGSAAVMRFAAMNEEERTALREKALSLEPDANLPFQVLR